MPLAPFCFILTACLQVSPDRTQFLTRDSVSLSCSDRLNSTGWTVWRRTPEGGVRRCSAGWGSASTGFTCVIGNAYPVDSGEYWCESPTRGHSNRVNITVTDGVIIEVPTRPVPEGAAVTLRCRTKNSLRHIFSFFKDGYSIRNSSTGEMSIGNASKADEGLYACSAAGRGESAGGWLAVQALAPPPGPESSSSLSVNSRVVRHLVVGLPYLLSTILGALIYRNRDTGKAAKRTNGRGVVMEITSS